MVKIDFSNNEEPAINDTNLNQMQLNIENAINSQVSGDTLPVGSIVAYSSTTIPTNWLLCDGRAISRTEYALLFSIIGTTYGVGDGSTTFNLPNLKGRVPVGVDSSQTEFDTLGETGGEKTVTLTRNNLPAYTVVNETGNIHIGTESGTISSKMTAATAINNLQPYQTTNYIIKAFQTAGVVAQVVNEYSESTSNVYSCDYINSLSYTEDISNKITKTSKVGTVYAMQAYKKGSRCYFSAQFDLLQEGSGLFTIDASLRPKYFEVGTGINYQAGSSEPIIIKISANTLSIDSNLYASALKSYAIIHIEWEVL